VTVDDDDDVDDYMIDMQFMQISSIFFRPLEIVDQEHDLSTPGHALHLHVKSAHAMKAYKRRGCQYSSTHS
jgi:hypothetical protein